MADGGSDAAIRLLVDPQLRAFAMRLSYVLRVPGRHPSGLSYTELLDILASQGRDFAADSRQLRSHVLYALREQFGGDAVLPGRAQLAQIASAAIVEWIVARFENGLRDVPIKAITSGYRATKRAAGEYTSVGMRTGSLRDAIKSRATAIVK